MTNTEKLEAGFILDPRLKNDTFFVTEFTLSRVLLMNDSRYPWLILVPRRANLNEIHDLPPEDQNRLIAEISTVSRFLTEEHSPDKVNVGALGNIVAQLHVHVIARNKSDATWPGPVWGIGESMAYPVSELDAIIPTFINGLVR